MSKFGKVALFAVCCLGCEERGPGIRARIKSYEEFGIPSAFIVEIHNYSTNSVLIYPPKATQYFFWKFEIEYLDGSLRTYAQRGDIAWFESDPVSIPKGGVYIDTLETFANDFYEINKIGSGCSPFYNSKRVRLVYDFKGAKFPSENLDGVFVPENIPLKYQTEAGVFKTNWMATQKINADKIKELAATLEKVKGVEKEIELISLPRLDCGE